MPLRLLRDWTQSDKMDSISVYAERFFTRLIMKADDYGCFYADARLLKANLFPLKIDSIREADLLRWIAECVKAQLIVLYESDNKRYLQIVDFRQRLDKAKAKFPLPNENTESLTTSTESMAETESDIEVEQKKNILTAAAEKTDFQKFQDWIIVNAKRVSQMTEPFTEQQFVNAKAKYGSSVLQRVLVKMHNWKKLLSANVSAYRTFLNWADKEQKETSSQKGMVF